MATPKFLSSSVFHALERFTSPGAARQLDAFLASGKAGQQPVAVSASGNAVYGQTALVDATAGNVVMTAPDPTVGKGQSFTIVLVKTASSHTLGVAAHGSETFNGTTAPAASSTVGALWEFLSDGTNWVITKKI